MNLIHKIEHWGDAHHPQWVDYLRIALGIVIFAKGVSFVNDRDVVQHMIEQSSFHLSSWGAVHYVVFTHLVGGLFLILGFQTRLASLTIISGTVRGCIFC
ncbi:DoxX family protein [Sphingobacterium sp. 40-24]|uniref:DoxX family protein n=1 Tax=Sphingobacterium sp. 40-24 TaxID=1895843 RepID=UPI000AC4BB50